MGYKGIPCQNRCEGCYDSQSGFSQQRFSFGSQETQQLKREVEKIIDWKKDGFQVDEVYLAGGGEPSLFPEIAAFLIDAFTQTNRNVWLTTNGIHLSEPLFSSLLFSRGILASVNGSSRESYRQQTHYDGFGQVINTLSQLISIKQQRNPNFKVIVTHFFNPSSIPDLENFVYQLDKLGVDEFRCRYDLFKTTQDECNALGKSIITNIVKNGNVRMNIVMKSPPNETLPNQYKCFAPYIWPTWNPLHGLFPCAHVNNTRNKIDSAQNNGIYSMVDVAAAVNTVMDQNCHRRCPSRIHWFNLYLNNHDLNIENIPKYSILINKA